MEMTKVIQTEMIENDEGLRTRRQRTRRLQKHGTWWTGKLMSPRGRVREKPPRNQSSLEKEQLRKMPP